MVFVYTHKDLQDRLLEFGDKDWRFGIWFDDKESGWYYVGNGHEGTCGNLPNDAVEFFKNMVSEIEDTAPASGKGE